MSDRPDLSSAEVILALPEFQLGSVTLVSNEDCEIEYRGRIIKTSNPGDRVLFKRMPKTYCHYSEETDLLTVSDSNGQWWRPVHTEDGWRRVRA